MTLFGNMYAGQCFFDPCCKKSQFSCKVRICAIDGLCYTLDIDRRIGVFSDQCAKTLIV